MNAIQKKFHLEKNQAFQQIYESDSSDIDKLSKSFHWLTGKLIEQGEAEIELLRAMSDEEVLVKEHIKVNTLKYCQELFDHCFQLAVERKAFDDKK